MSILTSIVSDIAQRQLSEKELKRTSFSVNYILEEIADKVNSMHKLRDDGFFKSDSQWRSSAEEIFEAVLFKCKGETEEKKLKYISNIMVNVAFTNDISADDTNYLIKIVENLTYRQLCLWSLFANKDKLENIKLRNRDYSDGKVAAKTIPILQEITNMVSNNILARLDEDAYEGTAILDWGDIRPASMELGSYGGRYYSILDLSTIPEHDVLQVAKFLQDVIVDI